MKQQKFFPLFLNRPVDLFPGMHIYNKALGNHILLIVTVVVILIRVIQGRRL